MSNIVKVLDGGLAIEIESGGCVDFDDHPLWTAKLLKDNPTAIKEAHKKFLNAGCNAIITASYQASIEGFVKHCNVSAEEARVLIQSSVDIAKEAVKEVSSSGDGNHDYYVAASVGPYGATLHDLSEYNGQYVDDMNIQHLKDWHRERIALLLSREPDYLAIETMPALKEVTAILDVLKEFPDAKAWVTFTCKDGKSTFHNDDFVESVKVVSQYSQVKSIGINCCRAAIIEDLIRSMKDAIAPQQTLIVYPNNARSFQNGRWVKDTPDDLSKYAQKWLKAGNVEWIGGCCDVGSKQINEISNIVSAYNRAT